VRKARENHARHRNFRCKDIHAYVYIRIHVAVTVDFSMAVLPPLVGSFHFVIRYPA
jgi:hypothetical protein